jgi:hypothetical protein
MKTTQLGEAETSALDTNQMSMGINTAGFAHLMSTLANLYSNPALAVLREYTSNGFDSHVKAGVARPIRVHMAPQAYYEDPTQATRLTATMAVEDFGAGMSLEDLRTIYSQYAASTKRDNNAEIGGFGLGAKSALSIAESFLVVSRKDGKENRVSVHKDARGVGVLTFEKERKTSEGNGVKVTIPLNQNHYNQMIKAINEGFFEGMPSKSVEIHQPGKAAIMLRSIQDEGNDYLGIRVGGEMAGWIYNGEHKGSRNDLFYHHGGARHITAANTFLLVGGVRYPVDLDTLSTHRLKDDPEWFRSFETTLNRLVGNGAKMFLNLNIGGVDLAPNRESVKLTDKTVRTIWNTAKTIFATVPALAKAELNKQTTYEGALTYVATNWQRFMDHRAQGALRGANRDTFTEFFQTNLAVTWRGKTMVYAFDAPHTVILGQAKRKVDDRRETKVHFAFDRLSEGTYHNSGHHYAVIADTVDEEIVRTMRRDVRSIAQMLFGDKDANAYLFDKAVAIPDEFRAVMKVLTYEEAMALGLKFRKEQREGKTVSTRKAPSVNVYNGVGNEVLSIPMNELKPRTRYFYAEDSNEGKARYGQEMLSTLFGAYIGSADEILGALYPSDPVVLLPKSRSVNALNKFLTPDRNILWDLHQQIVDLLDAGETHKVKAIMNLRYLGMLSKHSRNLTERGMANLNGFSNVITNNTLRAIIRLLGNGLAGADQREYALALVLGWVKWDDFAKENEEAMDKRVLDLLTSPNNAGYESLHGIFGTAGVNDPVAQEALVIAMDAVANRYNW